MTAILAAIGSIAILAAFPLIMPLSAVIPRRPSRSRNRKDKGRDAGGHEASHNLPNLHCIPPVGDNLRRNAHGTLTKE